MAELDHILSAEELKKTKSVKFPGFKTPMLATLTDDYFDDPNWIYERKLDGVRCLVCIQNGKVNLFSRNENDISSTYPELKNALKESNYPNLIIDGEIVAFDGKVTSFSRLQSRMQLKDSAKIKATTTKVFLYVFDILYYQDSDLTQVPLRSRKKVLKKVLNWTTPIRYVVHKNEYGKTFLEQACVDSWEGIIAKNSTSAYVHSRNKNWLKFKCSLGQELVIAGFTDPEGERVGFGALLVGFYKGKDLYYAGKVGTGFDDQFLKIWRKKFDAITQTNSPFVDFIVDKKHIHWLQPLYVGQFGFSEWTKTNKLRHPRFLGMRDDKDPKKVIKETAQ